MFIVLLIAGCLAIFWIGVAIFPESRDEKAQRMQENLDELRNNKTAPLLKFKTHEEGMQFLKMVAEKSDIRSLPPVYREQAERYLSTRPLTIVQARAELKEVCGRIIEHAPIHATPKACVKEWERLEEMAERDQQQYYRAMKARLDKPWFRMPKDEDLIYCVLDIVIQDEFPDTEQLYKYISNLTDDGIEKLMDIIGNKLERLNG